MKTLFLVSTLAAASALSAQSKPEQAPAPEGEGLHWSDLVKSGKAVRFYGFFRLDSYYDTARANNIILPAFVVPEDGSAAKEDDNAFALDPRLTRFGLDVLPVDIGASKASGKLEIDFANFPSGVPESRATPRIRLAYADIDHGDWGLRFGQDWDVISPLYPAVNSELLLWLAGNLGDRRPMVQGRWSGGSDAHKVELRVGLGTTGAIDNKDLDPTSNPLSIGERDGFDSGLPHVQARLGLDTESWVEGKRARIGVWGLFGKIETDTQFGGKNHFDSWVVGADWTVPLCPCFLARGEIWTGQALGDVRGGIGQTINTTTGAEIGSSGGFAELWWQASHDVRLHAGGSVDDPDNADLSTGFRSRNMTAYTGTKVDFGEGLTSGLDVIFWETDWVDNALGNMVRVNAYVQYDF